MSQELVLKSKNYLDKNTSIQKVSNLNRDTVMMIASSFVLGSLVPVIWTASASSAWSVASGFVAIPVFLVATAIFGRKFNRRLLRKRVLSICKKMGLELTREEKKHLKANCDTLCSFEMVVSDRIHKISVETNLSGKHLIKVESSQDALLRQVVTNAITMKSESHIHDLDISKMVLEDNAAPFKKEISRQITVFNAALKEDPDFKIDNGRVALGSRKVVEEYKVLKSFYEQDLDRRMEDGLNS